MRTATHKIIFLLFVFCPHVFALDLSVYENQCSEIGFKKKTLAFGECVLELHSRGVPPQKASNSAQANTGDGTNEHQMCAKFGFVAGTSQYSECRLKIDIAKKEQAQRQAAYDAEQQRYQEEQRRYDAQVAEYEKEKERQKGLALMRFGAALAGGTSPSFAENFGNAGRQSLGIAPVPPTRPQIQNFTITNPAGRMTNCNVVGNNINCF
jgi:hypothetical protein